jgi:tripartite-type tricarboxylate transporter receptor subunit TctC
MARELWRLWRCCVGAVLDRLAAEMQKIQAMPDFREQLYRFGMEPSAPNTPAEFAAIIVADQPRWAKAVKDSGAKVD